MLVPAGVCSTALPPSTPPSASRGQPVSSLEGPLQCECKQAGAVHTHLNPLEERAEQEPVVALNVG